MNSCFLLTASTFDFKKFRAAFCEWLLNKMQIFVDWEENLQVPLLEKTK
jgi:hypothetical protein